MDFWRKNIDTSRFHKSNGLFLFWDQRWSIDINLIGKKAAYLLDTRFYSTSDCESPKRQYERFLQSISSEIPPVFLYDTTRFSKDICEWLLDLTADKVYLDTTWDPINGSVVKSDCDLIIDAMGSPKKTARAILQDLHYLG